MSSADCTVPAPPPRRPPPRQVSVVGVRQVSPRVLAIRFGGEHLASFPVPRPSAHIKVFFAEQPDAWAPASAGPRPPSRTYTPRHVDTARSELAVEFVLHGEGLASTWAAGAKPGDSVWVRGPGGGFEVDPGLRHIVILADESALPAAGMILEALPPGCTRTIYCEVENAGEDRSLSPSTSCDPHWLHRGARPSSTRIEEALGDIDAPPDALWWVACEATAMRRIRRHLLVERRLDPRRMITRGYWMAGASNHPDHDYGEG